MSPSEVQSLQEIMGRMSEEIRGIKAQADRQGAELREMSGAITTLAQQTSRVALILERIEKAEDTRAETCPWRVEISRSTNNREEIAKNAEAINRLWKADSDRRVAIAKWTAIGSGSGLAVGMLIDMLLKALNMSP